MNNLPALSITEVERLTGIRQATLRMWEKRYGFPQPLRDQHGDRVYPPNQVERLQTVRRLMDQGMRPGKILCGDDIPDAVAGDAPSQDPDDVPPEHAHVLKLLRAYRRAELYGHFQYRLLDLGLRRFVIECLAPLSVSVGAAWARGDLPVRCEHLYTQVASSILHVKQAPVRTVGDGSPTILLATLTSERHALGILMAEAVMNTLGVHCIQLGSDLPPLEVAAAARESAADIVALSFSSYFPRRFLLQTVMALRAALPPATAIWIGGAGSPPAAALVPGVDVVHRLDAIDGALALWHARFGR